MKNEPAVVLSTILAIVVAGLGLLTEFGVNLTSGQQTAILTLVGAVGALVVGIITRSLVTPFNKVVTQQSEGNIVAGPANSLPTGTVVKANDLDSNGRDDATGRFV